MSISSKKTETKSNPSKKDLQKKVADVLNAFVKSITTIDTKKIKKAIKRASKTIAKSVKKSINESSINSNLKKTAAVRKRTSKKLNKKTIAKSSPENVLALLKNKQIKSLKEILPKKNSKKILETPRYEKNHKF
ncbi:MAG: hypothetical protein K8R85_04815 [Bacteroidetes bacterium]|nr:hypothetical protein [Bacteroidota bacterium]